MLGLIFFLDQRFGDGDRPKFGDGNRPAGSDSTELWWWLGILSFCLLITAVGAYVIISHLENFGR